MRVFDSSRRDQTDFTFSFFAFDKSNRRILIGILHRPNALNRPPELRERLGFIRLQVAKIGLIIGVDTTHQFEIGRAVIAEFAVPGTTEGRAAPSPLLFPRCK